MVGWPGYRELAVDGRTGWLAPLSRCAHPEYHRWLIPPKIKKIYIKKGNATGLQRASAPRARMEALRLHVDGCSVAHTVDIFNKKKTDIHHSRPPSSAARSGSPTAGSDAGWL